mmetsp:Transcript_51113/g.144752  ORF Transcript_51113/g.144752 Transcript_51113/m.144752 type:complete len:113 (-) Transcript_51113:18-356(-)
MASCSCGCGSGGLSIGGSFLLGLVDLLLLLVVVVVVDGCIVAIVVVAMVAAQSWPEDNTSLDVQILAWRRGWAPLQAVQILFFFPASAFAVESLEWESSLLAGLPRGWQGVR